MYPTKLRSLYKNSIYRANYKRNADLTTAEMMDAYQESIIGKEMHIYKWMNGHQFKMK